MSNIDWSKAPADAQAYMPPSYQWIEGWWKKKGEQFYFWPFALGESGGWSSSYARPFDHRDVVMRPAPQWSGEGLPPVGTPLECQYAVEGFTAWHAGECIGVGFSPEGEAMCAVKAGETISCYRAGSRMRPIRTPSQIAADEREEAIKDLTAGCGSDALRSWAIRAYDDLGYRKGGTK